MRRNVAILLLCGVAQAMEEARERVVDRSVADKPCSLVDIKKEKIGSEAMTDFLGAQSALRNGNGFAAKCYLENLSRGFYPLPFKVRAFVDLELARILLLDDDVKNNKGRIIELLRRAQLFCGDARVEAQKLLNRFEV